MKKKIILAVFAAVITVSLLVGTVYAVLSARSGAVTNKFEADTDPEITVAETFKNNVKSNVKISVNAPAGEGSEHYSVYVRAKIVVTWKDSAGNVYSKIPVEGVDYSLDTTVDGNPWIKLGDGIYYHKARVNDGSETGVLIESCTQLKPAPNGYHLSVEILSQTVQAEGTTDTGNIPAVVDAWKVKLDEHKLITGLADGSTPQGNVGQWEVGQIVGG